MRDRLVSPRIVHIIDSIACNGVARQMLLLARGLVNQGLEVHVAVLSDSSNIGRASGGDVFPIIHLGRRGAIDPLADWRLLRHVGELRPDVVHTWDTIPGMLGPLAANSFRRLVSRMTASGRSAARPRLIAGFYRIERWRRPWDAWWERGFSAQAERIVTNSATVRDWCVARGLPAEKLTVIPPAVPPARESNISRGQLLQELQLASDARLIGVIGRLVPEKRVQDLIWAADLLRVLHDNLRMLIIGGGPLRPQLEQYARMASDLDHIRFLGERDDLWRIMPHLDVLWNGDDNRSVSIAMLEAMAAGVPVVASDVPVNREIVIPGETGFLVPIGVRSGRADRARHTDRIFTDAALAARLAEGARERVAAHFSNARMLEQHIGAYAWSFGRS